MRKIVIVGLGAAGFAAVTSLRRIGYRGEITVIDPKPSDLFHPCGIPYVIEGKADIGKITQSLSLNGTGIEMITGSVLSINPAEKKISVQTPDGNFSVSYDALLLCSGSSPSIPPLRGISLALNKGLFSLSNTSDLSAVLDCLPEKRSAVVIGAGAIGLESAAALRNHCGAVTVIEAKEEILSGMLDPDMAKDVREILESQGIAFHLGESADDVFFDGEFRGVSVSRKRIDAEIGICAAGTAANIAVAKGAGIECGSFGICVDRSMKTNVEAVYAAGDCVETFSVIDGKPIPAKLASSAWIQGTAAALSLTGSEKEYSGSAGTFVIKPGSLEIAGTGFTVSAAAERGFDPVMARITASVRPDYMHQNGTVTVKIVADRITGRILGAQAFGEGAAGCANLVSEALVFGASLESFLSVELAYCPAVSDVISPLMRAAEGALRRTRR